MWNFQTLHGPYQSGMGLYGKIYFNDVCYSEHSCLLPRAEASLATFGLIHLTVGRRDSKSTVLAAGSISELCTIITIIYRLILKFNFFVTYLLQEGDFNGVKLTQVATPHTTLAISQSMQDQQTE